MESGSKNKRILFLTGTRADFGKLKPLIVAVEESSDFHCTAFVTGMHTLYKYGYTVNEVKKCNIADIHIYHNQIHSEPMELSLANTIAGLSRYVHENVPDMIVVHGDRVEALAGAIVGAMRNILTAHIEGGEISGTVDELIRHSVTKLAHLHFVSNQEAADRLRQLGEKAETIHLIGSPEIDTMLSDELPDPDWVRDYYDIPFSQYAIALLHPVTTELDELPRQAEIFAESLLQSKENYLVIYPNNDEGTEQIFFAYEQLKDNPRIQLVPSLRFEYFLSLLKQARFVIGNSSMGIRQAPIYAVRSVNIGSRQHNRFQYHSIQNVEWNIESILKVIANIRTALDRGEVVEPCLHFGKGNSLHQFMKIIRDDAIWGISRQKVFNTLVPMADSAPMDTKPDSRV